MISRRSGQRQRSGGGPYLHAARTRVDETGSPSGILTRPQASSGILRHCRGKSGILTRPRPPGALTGSRNGGRAPAPCSAPAAGGRGAVGRLRQEEARVFRECCGRVSPAAP